MKDKVYAAFEESYKQIIAELAAKRTAVVEKKYEPSVKFEDFVSLLKTEISSAIQTKSPEVIPQNRISQYTEQLSKISSAGTPLIPNVRTQEQSAPPQSHPNSSFNFVGDSMEFYDETSGDSSDVFKPVLQTEAAPDPAPEPPPPPPVSLDADALAYINSVEAAEGQQLESGVRQAISDFVAGCKSDGIWNSFISCCILAGARTLNGALIPLVGTAPSNVNFIAGDYSRIGLQGGTSKYLNSNIIDSSIAQDDFHMAIWQQQALPSGTRSSIGVQRAVPYYTSSIIHSGNNTFPRARASSSTITTLVQGASVGLFGVSRNNSASYNEKRPGASVGTLLNNSAAPLSLPYYVFSSNNNGSALTAYNGTLSFYSIGGSLNLEMLSTRVSALMSAIQAAI
jgi:hypothetical protein